jgi:glycosyltransferase involved in cell wall biosynthesis
LSATKLCEGDDDPARTAHAEQVWPWFPVDGRWLSATERTCADWQPDIVVIEYIRLSYLLRAVPDGILTMLDSHDVMSHRMALFASHGRLPTITISARDEAEILRRFDVVIAISRFDMQYMRDRLGVPRVFYVPHAIETAPDAGAALGDGRSLIFVAGHSDANVAGIGFFLREVWPPLARSFTLHVYGSICGDAGLRKAAGVVLHGHAPDLAEAYSQADIAINPVFMGGGLKIKTLEAMSAGLPCVTTAEGARGVTDACPDALWVAENATGFIDGLVELADDAGRRRKVGEAARAYVQRQFSATAAFRDMRLLLGHL